jgi:hypothetical protein
MNRRYAKFVVLALLIGAAVAIADDVTPATHPATAVLALRERTPPSEERKLFFVRLTLPKLDDRTPLEATVVARENGQEIAFRKMVPSDAKGKDVVVFARACNPAEIVAEGIVRLRERNHVTGKIETIDLPLVDAVEIEKP